MNKQIAYPHTIRDIVHDYHTKLDALGEAQQAHYRAQVAANEASRVIGGTAAVWADTRTLDLEVGARLLTESAWRALYVRLNLQHVFSSRRKREFETFLSNPDPLTPETLAREFGEYYDNPRHYILMGLAECFVSLDPFYRSHSNFGIGKKGLPKRVIISNFAGFRSTGADKLKDVCAAMLQVWPDAWLGEHVPEPDRKTYQDIIHENTNFWGVGNDFKVEQLGLEVRQFKNGNAHVYFSPRALNLVNDALHEFYGELLPDDTPEEVAKRAAGTDVAKDLQFYPTPPEVVERMIRHLHHVDGMKVLEPSCGEGAILDVLKEHGAKCFGIEYHAGRVAICRGKGHAVHLANFLEVPPTEEYDLVIMNPPFYGKHYQKHIEHALKFLKTGGRLVSVMPATAWYEHGYRKGTWVDLPVGSFRSSGTNVNTGFLTIRKN